MCRFLMVKSQNPFCSSPLLEDFAEAVRTSRAANGDLQNDGWGVCWFEEEKKWRLKKSLRPVWEDAESFAEIPETRFLIVHARSASLKEQVGEIAHNQPFMEGGYAFVFNGFLQGVSLPMPTDEGIGSQKIWRLLLDELEFSKPADSLRSVANLLKTHSRFVQAMNIGLCDSSSLYAFSSFAANPEYYTLHVHRSGSLRMISSEALKRYRFTPLPTERVVEL